MQSDGYVSSFAFQIPIWVVIPILLVAALGAWKLVKLVLAALAD